METWEHIYNQNSAKLLGVCRRYVQSNEVAEDVMHDAFETAMQKIDTYSGKGSFEGWLYQITVNTALQYIRKNKKVVNKSDEVLDYHMKSEEENTLPKNKKTIVHQAEFEVSDLIDAIDLLPEHHKAVFNLYVLEKYSHQQISQELGITVNTSKSHLNRARKKLQDILYKKAKEQEKENRKKYLFLLFPFLFSIDGLYAQKLKDYKITPVKSPTFLEKAVASHHHLGTPILYTAKAKIILGTAVAFLVGTAIFVFKTPKEKKYIPKAMQQTFNVQEMPSAEGSVSALEEIINSQEKTEQADKIALENKKTPKTVKIKVPVVVHKQVIIKDTINP